MKKIAVSGSICCGKSTLLQAIKDLGYEVASCDEMVAEIFKTPDVQSFLYEYETEQEVYITEQLYTKEQIRKWMALDSKFALHYLAFIGPLIKEAMNHSTAQVIEVPLLIENNVDQDFQWIFISYCSDKTQIKRMKERGYSHKEIAWFLKNQLPQRKKIQWADFTFNSDEPIDIDYLKDCLEICLS